VRSELKTDIAWSAAAGLLVGVSPHTGSARLIPSIVGGGLVAGATYLVRSRGRDARELSARVAVPLVGWLCLLLAAVAFAPTLAWLFREYSDSIWRNGHGILLPLLITWLVRRALRRADLPDEEPSAWGLPFVVVGCALSLLDVTARTGYLGVLGFVIATPGLSLLVLGPRRTRAIAFPLSLVVFAFPVPLGVLGLFSLSAASGWLCEVWLGLLGMHPPRLENWFVLSTSYLHVSQNCSGLAPLYGAVLASLVIGHWSGRWSVAVVLLLFCWPVTVFINSFRVAALILLSERLVGPQVLDTPIHGMSGIATFWVVVLVIVAAGRLLGGRARAAG
jgi:exosortase